VDDGSTCGRPFVRVLDHSAADGTTSTTPVGLLAGSRSWCHLRDAERVFRLSEILSVGYP
jgi:predicted DNA-binding transcriptional regulator YafY